MAIEIERRFLVDPKDIPDSVLNRAISTSINQGYFDSVNPVCRVRLTGDGQGFLTIKGRAGPGTISREEFEYEIPHGDALRMYKQFCDGRIIRKIRHRIPYGSFVIELDEFLGSLYGLWIAEIELKLESDKVDIPTWFGREVTKEPLYSNYQLAIKANLLEKVED